MKEKGFSIIQLLVLMVVIILSVTYAKKFGGVMSGRNAMQIEKGTSVTMTGIIANVEYYSRDYFAAPKDTATTITFKDGRRVRFSNILHTAIYQIGKNHLIYYDYYKLKDALMIRDVKLLSN